MDLGCDERLNQHHTPPSPSLCASPLRLCQSTPLPLSHSAPSQPRPSSTHPLTHSPTHPLTHSPTHPLTYSPTHLPATTAIHLRLSGDVSGEDLSWYESIGVNDGRNSFYGPLTLEGIGKERELHTREVKNGGRRAACIMLDSELTQFFASRNVLAN